MNVLCAYQGCLEIAEKKSPYCGAHEQDARDFLLEDVRDEEEKGP